MTLLARSSQPRNRVTKKHCLHSEPSRGRKDMAVPLFLAIIVLIVCSTTAPSPVHSTQIVPDSDLLGSYEVQLLPPNAPDEYEPLPPTDPYEPPVFPTSAPYPGPYDPPVYPPSAPYPGPYEPPVLPPTAPVNPYEQPILPVYPEKKPQCSVVSEIRTHLSTFVNTIVLPSTYLSKVPMLFYRSTTSTEYVTKTELVRIEDQIAKYLKYPTYSTVTESKTSISVVSAPVITTTLTTTTTIKTLESTRATLVDTVVIPQVIYETTTFTLADNTTVGYFSTICASFTLDTPTINFTETYTRQLWINRTLATPIAITSTYLTSRVSYAKDTTLPVPTSTERSTTYYSITLYRTTVYTSTNTSTSTLYNTINYTYTSTYVTTELHASTTTFLSYTNQIVTVSGSVEVDTTSQVRVTNTTTVYTPYTVWTTSISNVIGTKTMNAGRQSTTTKTYLKYIPVTTVTSTIIPNPKTRFETTCYPSDGGLNYRK